MRLDGETRLIPILGDPIAQVKSPALLTAALAERGLNAIVPPVHVSAANFARVVAALKYIGNVDGLVITVPHKFTAASVCDRLTAQARFIGGANIIRREADGTWLGDHSDGQGYVAGIRAQGGNPEGRAVLLVGAGGAGSAIAYEFLRQNAREIAIHDADTARRDDLIARLNSEFPGRAHAGSTDPRGFDILANATPLGMRPDDPLPVQVDLLTPPQFVADCVTRPEVPPLIAAARQAGCATMTGLGMFNGVAERMVEFFAGTAQP
ncbi:MAG: shikimate dehydrogenase [Paracoccus sp. (in: a-proteobacteria)]|uniref:shikimate dehydrogenase family protein n=1 Tax=Paracoccus sp. TaxID=267 RepID=UPI0026DF9D75|nr:shikimate dehydrogenase [Paracoccus sp. (in: a-proteobacteria)]MDO5631237.1 shikimate dehydrogenase [Paracoccus sp. (in: a-proteobacteria)]